MAEKDDKEKETKLRIDTRGAEIDRDVRSSRSETDRDRDSPREPDRDRNRNYDDDYDRPRPRRDARDVGESVRDTGRSARRASSDFLTFGCDLLGDLFIGVGEALTPRRRSSRSRSSSSDDDSDRSNNCFDQFGFEVRTYNRSDRDEDDDGGSSRDNGGSDRSENESSRESSGSYRSDSGGGRNRGRGGIQYQSNSYERSNR